MKSSIRSQLITLVAAVALPAFALLGWSFWSEVRRQHGVAREQALRIARSVAADMSQSNDRSHALLARMAVRPKIAQAEAADCDSLFAIVDFFPQYLDLILYDEQGIAICSAAPAPDDAPFVAAVTPRIEEHLRSGKAVSAPFVANVRGRWVSVAFQPVRNGGAVTGTLALLQYLELDVEAYRTGAVITIVDRDGLIIARTQDGALWEGKQLPDSEIRRFALGGGEGRADVAGIDGERRQYGFAPIRGGDWIVFVGLPAGSAMADVRSLLIRGTLIGIVIVALVVILALRLSRGIERPLDGLARAAQRVGEEGFVASVPVGGPREVAIVANAFNQMVASRAEAEQALIDSRSQLEALSKKLLDVQEEERTRIAREIHDELGQLLTALNMDIGGLLQTATLTGDQAAMARRIRQALAVTISSVQRISTEIRPAALDDFGLVAAIESEMRLFERRTGIECELSTSDDNLHLGGDIDAAVYRIVQEAMTNVARHSNASRMEVRLRHRGNELLVDIRDDGRGITEGEIADRHSLGLLGMRERARSVGGTLEVEGIEGRGTIIALRIALSAPGNAAAERGA